MRSDLRVLQITPNEVDDCAGLTVMDQSSIALYRAMNSRRLRPIWTCFLGELLTLGIIVIFVVPLVLIGFHHSTPASNEISTKSPSFVGAFAVSLIIFLVWNGCLLSRIKLIKSTAKLLREVERFNQVIQSIELLDQLESVQSEERSPDLENRQQILQVLQLTRENLTNALQADKLLRLHKNRIQYHNTITAFEQDLIEVMTFSQESVVGRYQHLLSDALHINFSVHQELRKL